jgi:uncharacterized protein (TIGR03663 family)
MAETALDRNMTGAAGVGGARKTTSPQSALERKLIGNLSLEQCVYIVVFAIAVFTRLYMAGVRPYHHDESIHAFFSWKITQDGVGEYQYDPVYHGPVLYYWTALVLRLFGDSDFTGRLSPVLAGLALIAFAWPLRRYLGRWGALAFLILVTFSPGLTYFSRFLRHDIYLALFNLGAIYFLFRYGEARESRYLYFASAAFALAFCTKEDMYALAPVFALSLIIMMVWEVLHAADWRGVLRSVAGETWGVLRAGAVPLVTAAIIFAVVWLMFYTSLFTHSKNWNSVTRALRYWWGQHEIKRIGGPWWYYFPHVVLYEPLIFFPAFVFLLNPLLRVGAAERVSTRLFAYASGAAAIAFVVCLVAAPTAAPVVLLAALGFAGLALMRRWLPDRFTRFMAIWTIGNFGFYSWAQEKVPWLLVPLLVPAAILAAMWFRQLIEQRAIRRPSTAVVLTALGVLTVWSLITSNYWYDAPRPDEAPGKRHAELLAYVQSTYDIHTKVMRRIEQVAATLGTGTQTRLAVSGNATWPLSWYLRHYPVNWSADVRSVDTPVVIIDKEATNAIDKALVEKYEKVPFEIRGWWEPDWKQLDLAKLARWLTTREAFNPVGSSDAVMYVLKDLKAGMTIAPVAVNPPPAARGYARTSTVLQPVAVWGEKGTAPGQFNEPRGLAVDAAGNLYVVDSKNNRIQKLSADGKPVTTWGHEGQETGNFKDPCGIAVGPDGAVYVADTWNHRIQKFDGGGGFITEWHEPGFWGPRGITVAPDGSAVYVTDTGNKRVVSFDPTGKQLALWGHDGSKPGELIEPVGIVADDSGRVIVADTGNHRIQIFDGQGKFIKDQFVSGWEEFYTEPYLALLGSDLLVTDSFNHRCARYADGNLVYSWGKTGSGRGDFNRPIGITTDKQGAVYVSDTMNNRIQKFVLPAAEK